MQSFSRDGIALCDNIGRAWEQLCRKDLGSDNKVTMS